MSTRTYATVYQNWTALRLTTAPTFTPISLNEAKDHLRITDECEDDKINAIIGSATTWSEKMLNWRLCTQRWEMNFDYWPVDIIRVPYPPLSSVVSIKYYDTDNNMQSLIEDTDYRIDTKSFPGRIEPIKSWPSVYDRVNPIEIEFECGYSKTSEIPSDIRDAIFLRLSDLYENRQNTFVNTGASMVINSETSENILMTYKLFNEP